MVNVTPDSFSDGGRYRDPELAIAHGVALAEAGADLLDVGGESTRPGVKQRISAAEEIARVVPVVTGLSRALRVPISIDTTRSEVARAAIAAGAEVVNDISGGLFDPELPQLCREKAVTYVCGHVRGRTLDEVHAAERTPPTSAEVIAELRSRRDALPAGLTVWIDPGLGFGKDTSSNLALCSSVPELRAALQCPVMVGPSRKRFLGVLTGAQADQRDPATVGAALACAALGADILRVHDVFAVKSALTVYRAILAGVHA